MPCPLASVPLLLCTLVPAQETAGASRPGSRPERSDFIRFVEVGAEEGRLETAVTTYEGPAGERVSLVAALHIADAAHYAELQELFRGYDALLYEMVGPQGHRPTRNQKTNNPLTMLQRLLKTGLELGYQLDEIDYSPENFVHADLDPKTMARLQKEKGENILTLLVAAMRAQTRRMKDLADERDAQEERGETPEPKKEPDLAAAFRNRLGRHTLRMSLARQFEDIEAMAAGLSPGKDGSVLLEGRNERALEVMQEELGKGKKNLGIYYGGAHMPHLERRLVDDLGFKRVGHRWLTAWDLHKRPDPVKKR